MRLLYKTPPTIIVEGWKQSINTLNVANIVGVHRFRVQKFSLRPVGAYAPEGVVFFVNLY